MPGWICEIRYDKSVHLHVRECMQATLAHLLYALMIGIHESVNSRVSNPFTCIILISMIVCMAEWYYCTGGAKHALKRVYATC